MPNAALLRAIASIGSRKLFAQKIGVTQQSVGKWLNKYNGKVPPDRVLQIYRVAGVLPHELRPDLYPNPTDGIPRGDNNHQS